MKPTLLQSNHSWTPFQRVVFRFLFAYIFLYCFSFPLYYIPGAHVVIHPIGSILQDMAVGLGNFISDSGNPISTEETGSGDTLLYWLLWITKLLLALLITILWSTLDRSRLSYTWLKKLLITYTRYYLALILLPYGLFKIVPTQFSEPTVKMMLQMYGDSSPMGLLWNFMGYSTTYQIFGGLAEVLGAVLLLFRRTTLLGALVLVGVMTNVVMMNYCFDVPVKLASTHYLLFAIGLAAVYGRPLVQLFLRNKSTEPMDQSPLFELKRWIWTAAGVKFVLVGFVFYSVLSAALSQQQATKSMEQSAVMAGVHDVERYTHQTESDSLTDNYRQYWHRMMIDYLHSDVLVVEKVNGEKLKYQISVDTLGRQMTGHLLSDSTKKIRLEYEPTQKDLLLWKGDWNKDSIWFTTKRFETDSMLLKSRTFRWVSPFPFNR
jgi:uncharacterized membrane protein YphA (DoxX/SURF4 family)